MYMPSRWYLGLVQVLELKNVLVKKSKMQICSISLLASKIFPLGSSAMRLLGDFRPWLC